MIPAMDFETYSAAGYRFDGHKYVPLVKGKPGLKAINAARYAEHESTRILCLSYDLIDGCGVRRWMPWNPLPDPLFRYIETGAPIEAHNAVFEWYVWFFICCRRLGWPHLPLHQMRCSMAKARQWCLPGSLEKVGDAIGAEQIKSGRGKKLIQLLSVPKAPTQADPLLYRPAALHPELHEEMGVYCDQDVRAEIDISSRLPEMDAVEFAVWQLDQRVNTRGVQIDMDSVRAAISIYRQAESKYTEELQRITGGAVDTVDKMGKGSAGDKWLQSIGVTSQSLDKGHVEKLLDSDIPQAARRALEIRQELGARSISKLFALERCANSDGRVRDMFVYCGAERTGRFAGRIFQPQNLKNSGPDTLGCAVCGTMWATGADRCPGCGMGAAAATEAEWGNKTACVALADIRTGSLERVEERWGNAISVMSSCLRSLCIASPGHDLICSDYSAIEAVVLAALAGEEWRLEVFRTHGKIYEMSAAKITGIPFAEIMEHKSRTGKHHPTRKKIGKVAELASGFGGWIGAWKAFGAGDFMTDEEIKQNVLAWRAASPSIEEFWGGQWRKDPDRWHFEPELYGLEGAVVQAIMAPGAEVSVRDIRVWMSAGNLNVQLPSGRVLVYHKAHVVKATNPLGLGVWQIRFWGKTANGGWGLTETYGGRLTENVVQAASRDILVAAMLRVEAAGYSVVMHVHDEIIAEVPKSFGSVENFERLMEVREPWFADWPIRAGGGWRGRRYRK